MVLHRFRSGWSAEGRLESRSLEELHLERSWSGSAVRTERFGQVGSLPVRQWFPLAAVEDQVVGVTWAAQLEWPGSWQMEVHRRYDNVALTGGLADREFGHWQKALVPGETLRAPLAILTCVEGDVDAACARLVQRLERLADEQPAVEQDLPITFNEFCTTWGDPQHDKVVRIARHLKGTPVRYFVIDAGWYKRPDATWANGHGDWQPSAALFPKGIEATAEAIRRQGLIPGLWFEAETCGEHSTAFSLIDHLLKRDGIPITAKGRRFWDLNDPWVRDYLSEKIIGLLERGSFGYVKIDYNETIGIGCDGAESQGEGLRQHLLGTWQLFDQLRERLPELVIENCASGGHRLEPSIVRRTAMSSFSDAHESLEIPIIGAALHRLIPPRQSLIWAVLRANDSRRRICYSLAAGFLGRLCLSGDIDQLSDEQGQLLRHGLDLYTQVTPVIKSGRSQLVSQHGLSWRYPKGWQAVLRESDGQLLVVVHTFAAAPDEIRLPLPGDRPWRVVGELTDAGAASVEQAGRVLHCPAAADFSGRVVWLKAG
ncbi:MAG: alpha-galactosidase [Verrucomicrobiota bacterium JB022]|nr:alpha-galactosidase [Verrucomicrobiota bacterium JB022]